MEGNISGRRDAGCKVGMQDEWKLGSDSDLKHRSSTYRRKTHYHKSLPQKAYIHRTGKPLAPPTYIATLPTHYLNIHSHEFSPPPASRLASTSVLDNSQQTTTAIRPEHDCTIVIGFRNWSSQVTALPCELHSHALQFVPAPAS